MHLNPIHLNDVLYDITIVYRGGHKVDRRLMRAEWIAGTAVQSALRLLRRAAPRYLLSCHCERSEANLTGDLAAAGGKAQAQRVEPDETFGVALVIDGVVLEGDVGEAVKASRGFSANDASRALV